MTRPERLPTCPELRDDRVDSVTEDDPRVIGALEEYMAVLERGIKPDRRDFLRRYEAVAHVLAPCLDGMELLRGSWRGASELPGSATRLSRIENESIVPSGLPECVLADFRIVREIGRGGMGVVYEAEQTGASAQRVALKVMPYAASLDRRQRVRFRTEVAAAARLDHPNIVPVVAAGSERGVPFYVMPLIEGESLAAKIQRRRESQAIEPARAGSTGEETWLDAKRRDAVAPRCRFERSYQDAARLGLQAARALEHAHGKGVLHRDIKPANLLVGAQGQLYVTDFGLARITEDLGVTISGDLIGTLRYMSPEQAVGRREGVDHRADIYSLGATLYELVTLRPAVAGQDAAELLRVIAGVEPVPPRTLAPHVPRSLDAIILKALAKDPDDRYENAGELADDLERFVHRLPVQARGVSLLKRGRRWSRRQRPALVRGASFAGSLAFALLCGTWLVPGQPASQADQPPADVPETAERSRRNLELAIEAVDQLSAQLLADHDGLQNSPAPEPAEPLQKALDLYRRLAQENQGDDSATQLVAAAHTRLGDVGAQLQRMDEALASYETATSQMEELVRREPEVLQHRLDLAATLGRLGQLLQQVGRLDDATASLQRSLAILEDLIDHHPGDRGLSGELASRKRALDSLLVASRKQGKPAPPIATFAELRPQRSIAESSSSTWTTIRPSSSS